MEFKLLILLAGTLLVSAAPAEKSAAKPKEDLKAEEGRQHYTVAKSLDYASDYSEPSQLHTSSYPSHSRTLHHEAPAYGGYDSSYAAPQPKPYSSGGTVTSYNRRGHSSASLGHAGDYAKPSLYGSRYNAAESSYQAPILQQSHGPSSSYSGPRDYAFAQPSPAYALPPSSYGHDQYAQSAPNNLRYADYGPSNAYSAESVQHSQDPSYDPAKDPVSQYAAYIPVREYGPKTHSDNRELSIYGY